MELHKIKTRIDYFCRNRVNAFSPTISPAPKSTERGEIESLYEGLTYFVARGQRELVVQPKYMGSYCDIYLKRELEASYLVSRNGYRIDHIDREAALNALVGLHGQMDWAGTELYIIQSELMPWSVLGGGLIDNEFLGYHDAHERFYDYLMQSELYARLDSVRDSAAYRMFLSDRTNLDGKSFRAKYPAHVVRQYGALEKFVVRDLHAYSQALTVYKTQVGLYGSEGDIHFKPFNILKAVHADGTETLIDNNLSYAAVNDDAFLHLHIERVEALDEQYPAVEAWYRQVVARGMEGVMIKPRNAFVRGLPPALKVRNPDYLVMIYGVDFQTNLVENIRKRKIEAKLKCSINDWALNRELLGVPYREIDEENYLLKNLVFDRIMGEAAESQLDSRL